MGAPCVLAARSTIAPGSTNVITSELLRVEEAEHRQHAAVILGRSRQPQLREDARYVLLDRTGRDEETLPDRLVRAALGHQLEHLALSRRERCERVARATAPDELGDDEGVE